MAVFTLYLGGKICFPECERVMFRVNFYLGVLVGAAVMMFVSTGVVVSVLAAKRLTASLSKFYTIISKVALIVLEILIMCVAGMLVLSSDPFVRHCIRHLSGRERVGAANLAAKKTERTKVQDGRQVPDGWTPHPRSITVGTPAGKVEKAITYYKNDIGMEFVWMPIGEHLGPQQRLMGGFWLARTCVTQREYVKVMGINPSYFRGEDSPVESVSWDDARRFARKLSRDEGLNYRLPSEVEWEYAARAGAKTQYYFGNNPDELEAYAWYAFNSGEKTHPVGSKIPNAFGLYDMYGNVWEWCSDVYHEKGAKDNDFRPTKGKVKHVLRGGSYGVQASSCRSVSRIGAASSGFFFGNPSCGFRLLLRPGKSGGP